MKTSHRRPRPVHHLNLTQKNVTLSFVQRFRVWNGSCSWVGCLRYAFALAHVKQLTKRLFAGVSELLIFHPVDTIAKRLMSNKAKVLHRLICSGIWLNLRKVSSLNSIIFRDAASAPLSTKLLSLFPGLGYAAGYKISQRIYKFGGQPWFNDLIKKNYKDNFTNTFGERNGKLMIQATAGRFARFTLTQFHRQLTTTPA